MTAQELVKRIASLVGDVEREDFLGTAIAKQIERHAYDLFFNCDVSYYEASNMLEKAGVRNYCGERDSFGPLSWVIETTQGNIVFG